MNKKLMLAALIASLGIPEPGRTQTIDTIHKRSQAAGIAAELNCAKQQGNGEENKLIRLLEGKGLGREVTWLKSEKGTRAVELIESEILSRDCRIRANINQEDLGKKLHPFLIDTEVASDDSTEALEELQHFSKEQKMKILPERHLRA